MVARDFFEVLISYKNKSMIVLKVARKSIGERVNKHLPSSSLSVFFRLKLGTRMLCFIELFSQKLVLPSCAVTLIGCTSCSALIEVIVA